MPSTKHTNRATAKRAKRSLINPLAKRNKPILQTANIECRQRLQCLQRLQRLQRRRKSQKILLALQKVKEIEKKGVFTRFSYFEYCTASDVFLSAFPSPLSTAFSDVEINARLPVGQTLFNNVIDTQLLRYLKHLKKHNFGASDNIGYWFPKGINLSTLSVDQILLHLNTLRVVSIAAAGLTHHVVQLVSELYPESPITVYGHSDSLKQIACDVNSVFYNMKTGIFSMPTSIRAANILNIGGIEVLSNGFPGYCYAAGEHVNPEEIEHLLAFAASLQGNIGEIRNKQFVLAMAKRAFREEFGEADIQEFANYLIGVHDTPGRDSRYWKVGGYGYQRESKSFLITNLFINATFVEEHTDTAEIASVNRTTLLSDVVQHFGTERMLAAFAAHVEMLPMFIDGFQKQFRDSEFIARFIDLYGPAEYERFIAHFNI